MAQRGIGEREDRVVADRHPLAVLGIGEHERLRSGLRYPASEPVELVAPPEFRAPREHRKIAVCDVGQGACLGDAHKLVRQVGQGLRPRRHGRPTGQGP